MSNLFLSDCTMNTLWYIGYKSQESRMYNSMSCYLVRVDNHFK